jgi:mannose-6-phosphate isomerase-like protein (cupin superfamily)
MKFETNCLPDNYDYLSPDNSEIRLLPKIKGGSLCHCTLPSGDTSQAVKHRSVEEIWFFIEGEGEVWRELNTQNEITNVKPGIAITISIGTHFQFKNTSDKPLKFIIVTMPPWPGAEEAVRVQDYWK